MVWIGGSGVNEMVDRRRLLDEWLNVRVAWKWSGYEKNKVFTLGQIPRKQGKIYEISSKLIRKKN